MHGNHPQTFSGSARNAHQNRHPGRRLRPARLQPATEDKDLTNVVRVDWTTWWFWRGACTRSHPELGRETPQRPWYCVTRRGRVGRRQVFPPEAHTPTPYPTHQRHTARGVEQPGSSSGS